MTPRPADELGVNVRDLSIAFPAGSGHLLAARSIGLRVPAGRTLGLVGESGSGKSVTLRALVGLVPRPGEVIGGEVRICGRDVYAMDPDELKAFRGQDIAMIFQDPSASLSPVHSVGAQVTEVLRTKLGFGRRAA
jgi:ABC-type dipeptide/oligopeptide/nickel transport system ATPase component